MSEPLINLIILITLIFRQRIIVDQLNPRLIRASLTLARASRQLFHQTRHLQSNFYKFAKNCGITSTGSVTVIGSAGFCKSTFRVLTDFFYFRMFLH